MCIYIYIYIRYIMSRIHIYVRFYICKDPTFLGKQHHNNLCPPNPSRLEVFKRLCVLKHTIFSTLQKSRNFTMLRGSVVFTLRAGYHRLGVAVLGVIHFGYRILGTKTGHEITSQLLHPTPRRWARHEGTRGVDDVWMVWMVGVLFLSGFGLWPQDV